MASHGHARSDHRHLRLHELALRKLAADPGLRVPGLALVERWLCTPANAPSRPWLQQWHEMLDSWDVERIAAVVLDPDDGQALRQCSPLGPTLTPRERWAALAAANAELDRVATTNAE